MRKLGWKQLTEPSVGGQADPWETPGDGGWMGPKSLPRDTGQNGHPLAAPLLCSVLGASHIAACTISAGLEKLLIGDWGPNPLPIVNIN